tara:strand:+ start:5349 stop:5762 length:414 start_codon:yes stop_codon:yes gene_type:complete
MSTVEINKDNHKKFFCEKCDYSCNKKSEFEKHIKTIKHNTTIIQYKKPTEYICNCGKIYSHRGSLHNHMKKCNINKNYICDCGKKYNYQSGLCKHKKKCNYKNNDILLELVKQNRELKELIVNQNKKIIEILENHLC